MWLEYIWQQCCTGIYDSMSLQWLCGVVAGLLHYLFLCVFCWMLAEGIMLYIMFIKVFGVVHVHIGYFLPLGWGEYLSALYQGGF